MANSLNQKQIEAIKKLGSQERYEHFIKKIADTEEVWTIRMNDGFLLFGDDEGNEFIPLWPNKEYVLDFQVDEWKNALPEMIPLEDFIKAWIPGMIKENKLLSVFPVLNQKHCTIKVEMLEKDILNELKKYE